MTGRIRHAATPPLPAAWKDAVLDRIRSLMQRAVAARLVTDADRKSLNECWLAFARVEVPYALTRIEAADAHDESDRQLIENQAFIGAMADREAFFRPLERLVEQVASIISPYVDPQADEEVLRTSDEQRLAGLAEVRNLLHECESAKSHLANTKDQAEMRQAAAEHAEASRWL